MNPVLILGGGINGAAVARELLLNRIPVCLVDVADIAGGATAASTRLAHGGLRYLEYADFSLVREALVERDRLLRLAPQFVRPLRFFIPIQHRISGVLPATARFLRSSLAAKLPSVPRGLWLVRIGLHWYDTIAKASVLPRHQVHHVGDPDLPPVDPERFPWLCSYYDAQMTFPERFVVALLHDAAQLAAEHQTWFRVLTYHCARIHGPMVDLHLVHDSRAETGDEGTGDEGTGDEGTGDAVMSFEPSMIVNATGAWVDRTLKRLNIPSRRLMGGTKGSHFLTRNRALRDAIGQQAIYAEATDGRPVFLIPLGRFTLVGTTDLPIKGDPSTALADPSEIEYLINATHRVFPHIRLTREEIDFHYCGVRPLPFSSSSNPASVTRRHVLEQNRDGAVPLLSLVGGKLTSCRELAEETAAAVCRRLGKEPNANSRDRLVPGAEDYPSDEEALNQRQRELAECHGLTEQQVQAVWRLCGARADSMLAPRDDDPTRDAERENIPGTQLPKRFVRRVIRQEWCTRLADLVQRRLMLLYDWDIDQSTLHALARMMVDEDLLDQDVLETEVEQCERYLRKHFGARLGPPG